MTRRMFAEEEAKFIDGYEDYPTFVIIDAFKTKFGWVPCRSTVTGRRIKARGTSNVHLAKRKGARVEKAIDWALHGQAPESA